ncbi:MAG: ABC transporter substrate-binding protein [Acidimicrobiales bacterium]
MSKGRALLAAVLPAAALVAVAACGGSTSDDKSSTTVAASGPTIASSPWGTATGPADGPNPQPGGRMVFGMEAEPEGLDPTKYAFSSSGHFVASAVFDPLATLDENGKAVPYLATAIDGSDDHKTWTITLPTGVTFHDGTPLTAKVVADDLEAYRKSYITQANFQDITSIEAPDETHVVVKLKTPIVDFPGLLATQAGYVFAPVMLDPNHPVDQPVGTGPFVFQSHTANQNWSFNRNPSYWRKGLPRLDAIDFRPVPDNAQRLTSLQNGDLDLINVRSAREINQLLAAPDQKLVENGAGEEEFLILNTEKPPFDSLTARKAVATAVDRERWRNEYMQGVDPVVNSPFAPGQPGYNEDNGFPAFDLQKAKDLVAEYKQETGKDLEFTYVTQQDVDVVAESQLLSQMFTDAGMKVTVTAQPQINLIANEASGNYQMGRLRLFSTANPDADALTFWRSTSIAPLVSLNFPRYVDKQVDDSILGAAATTDQATRDKAYQAINKRFAENLPYVWLGRTKWLLAGDSCVNGFYAGANGSVETIGPKTWVADLWVSQ